MEENMGKVNVCIEAFGEKALTKTFDGLDLEGRTVRDVVETMVKENWEGKDQTISDAIYSEINASGGYAVSKKIGGEEIPVEYEVIPLGNPIKRYQQEIGDENPTIRLAVSGHQVVGYAE